MQAKKAPNHHKIMPKGPVPIPDLNSIIILDLFPTCQVRVVGFYVSCPPSSSSFPSSPSPSSPSSPCPRPTSLCHLLRQLYVARCRSQWAAPDLIKEGQIAVGSAGPQQGGSDRSGRCRTSTGSSRAEWAAPDLTSQQVYQKICQKYVK